ncbi:MAG: FAD-dependent thymidylate synthase [Deltaproteobacteria bacterium]|nr:FAD-dependent thymidylate synthase [Deltaproteobacteria bacterium]
MRNIEKPKAYLVAKSMLVNEGLNEYLKDIGNPDWEPDKAAADGENLIEAAGRMCYRSWQPYDPSKPEATNPNVGRVRKGNAGYIGNVLKSGHGSILEHVSMTFICRNVSRVFTHELVRHRAGMAYSQESLRYVRLDDLPVWIPDSARANPEAEKKFADVIDFLENAQKEMARIFNFDDLEDFTSKKMLTSMFRRLAPIGIGTTIVVTGNLRSWRHIIEMRTSVHAEEEIRIVCSQIAEICKKEYPHVFQDMSLNDTTGEWVFDHPKV